MTMEQIGEMLLGITTSEQAAGVASAFVTGLILQGATGASNMWKFVIAMGVSLVVAPAALGLRVYLFHDPVTQESVSSAIFVSVAVAQATFVAYKGLLGAVARKVETKRVVAAIENTPVPLEAVIPLHELIQAQAKAQVEARPAVTPPETEPLFVLYNHEGQKVGTLASTAGTATPQPPIMRPVFKDAFGETRDMTGAALVNADTPDLPASAAQRIIGWNVEDPETGEDQFIPNQEEAQWIEANKMKPVPAVSAKVMKFPVRTLKEQIETIKGKDTPNGENGC